MVGVAGSSKGCNTCRKRKIHNLSALDRETLLTRTQPLVSLTDLRRQITVDGDARSVDQFTPGSDSGTGGTSVMTARITSQDQKFEGLRNTAGLAEVFVDFLANYIPRREEEEGEEGEERDTGLQNAKKTQQVSWLQAIDPSSLENSASLDLAILALSLSCLGRRHGDERLRREGTANYGRALRRLQDILSHHSLLLEEQTLASFSGKNTSGWVSHVEGMARLVELRGPESHMTGSSHRLFLGFRSTAITHALATRKSIFLAQRDWLTVPWKIHPKSDLDRLQDIMAQVATLLEKAERLRTASTSTAVAATVPERTALVHQGWIFHSQLQTWYQRLVRKHAGCGALYWERPVSARFHLPVPSVFTTSLQFPTFEIARLHLSYWTMLLLLRTSILSLASRESHPSNTDTDTGAEPPPPPPLEVPEIPDHDLATMICKSMDFFLSDDARILGPQNVFFALRVATHVFSRPATTTSTAGTPHHLRIVEWCRAVFDELDRRGYSLGRILAECPWDEIPALLSPRNHGITSRRRPGPGVELGDIGEG
ncbi:hypothetical protein AYO20_00191 [Fonsecaea nubica]|uniref:Transcription factor domain-containing protein n=1 Tax=Fonsecaea nubica TaxID=856822 RepID=A0A178DHD6_9EURO|nr:hypothetical protein AYO20_00191 [Fonsecaea nubica]OAL40455.1 hypothetical protein AYO20_00191 [Fonsecaea nubica]